MGDKERYTLFFGIQSPFSQFHPSKFTIDGVMYRCAEQYVMYCKAMTFKDYSTAKKIMETKDPKIMKRLGRKVRNFNKQRWLAKSKAIVRKASLAKFTQNSKLKDKLLKTVGTILVEASPWDTVWGIGRYASDPKSKFKKYWRGKNWLGYILTDVRDQILMS